METNRLRQFCAIVETGNLRKAAELLGISHSGLSKSMKAFELEAGSKLFRPSGRGIIITDAGLSLYERSHPFLAALKTLLGKEPQTTHPMIRLGSFEVFTTYFFARLCRDYWKEADVEVHDLVAGRLEEALLLNKIDFGITYEPIPRSGIEYIKIKTILMGAFTVRGKFTHTPLSSIPFAVPAQPLESTPSGSRGLDGWNETKFQRLIHYRVNLMNTGLELVRQGLAAIFIPKFVANLYNEGTILSNQLTEIELPKEMRGIRREVFIVKRESQEETPFLRLLAKAIHQICTD